MRTPLTAQMKEEMKLQTCAAGCIEILNLSVSKRVFALILLYDILFLFICSGPWTQLKPIFICNLQFGARKKLRMRSAQSMIQVMEVGPQPFERKRLIFCLTSGLVCIL